MDLIAECASALEIAMPLARQGHADIIRVFDKTLIFAEKHRSAEAWELAAVAHLGAAVLHDALGRKDEAHERRAKGLALVGEPTGRLAGVDLMADALIAIDENRRALPYCTRAVELTRPDAQAAAARLWRAGRCYNRIGFPDPAREALTESVALLRQYPEGLLLAYALLDLGGACLKSDPAAAAPVLEEAGALFDTLGKVSQAATAWVNLGVLNSRAGRFDAALASYEKARAARQRDPATTPAQRGNLHNNIATVYRRQGDLDRARAEVARALDILEPVGGEALAHALGTLGEIRRDAGEPEAALDAFSRARAVYEGLTDPNREKLAEKLTNEADALDRLGRAAEAAPLRARIAELHELAPPTAPEPVAPEAIVLVILDAHSLPTGDAALAVDALSTRIGDRLAETPEAGGWDGHVFGAQAELIAIYGSDARALFESIRPMLMAEPLCRGAAIELRQGDKSERFSLSPKRHWSQRLSGLIAQVVAPAKAAPQGG